MSDVANEYVKQLTEKKTGPDGKPMTFVELRVLKVLAWQHNQYVWCAWPKMRELADAAMMHQSTARKAIAGLVERGILRRYFALSDRWGEATSNEYEFVELGVMEVSQQERDMVFKYKRTRSAVQLSLRRGGRQRKQAGSTSGEQLSERSYERVEQEAEAGLDAAPRAEGEVCLPASDVSVARATVVCVDLPVDGVVGGKPESCGGQARELPVELYTELEMEVSPPLTPPPGAGSVEKPTADTFVSLYLGMERSKTTASAKATATTSALRSPVVSMERGGEAGTSSRAARVKRQPRDLGARRQQLDGEEVAVLDEAVRVLQGCGVAETTRSLCNAVIGALRLRVEQAGCTLSDAGTFAIAQWREYVSSSGVIHQPVGVKRFFGSGMWLDQHRWGWDKQALRELKQGAAAAIGHREA